MELCPPGTDENRIERIIKETKGDQIKIQNAISELWEGMLELVVCKRLDDHFFRSSRW